MENDELDRIVCCLGREKVLFWIYQLERHLSIYFYSYSSLLCAPKSNIGSSLSPLVCFAATHDIVKSSDLEASIDGRAATNLLQTLEKLHPPGELCLIMADNDNMAHKNNANTAQSQLFFTCCIATMS